MVIRYSMIIISFTQTLCPDISPQRPGEPLARGWQGGVGMIRLGDGAWRDRGWAPQTAALSAKALGNVAVNNVWHWVYLLGIWSVSPTGKVTWVLLCYLADRQVPCGQGHRCTRQSVGHTGLCHRHRTGHSPSHTCSQGKLKGTQDLLKHSEVFIFSIVIILGEELALFLFHLMHFKVSTMKPKPTQRNNCFLLRLLVIINIIHDFTWNYLLSFLSEEWMYNWNISCSPFQLKTSFLP